MEIKEELERLLEDKFSTIGTIKRLKKVLDEQIKDKKDIEKVENLIVSSIVKSKEIDYAKLAKLGISSISAVKTGIITLNMIYNRFVND